MSVGFSKPRYPERIPEHVLWTLAKDGRQVQARTRMTPIGPELRVYASQSDGALHLLWSRVFRGATAGAALGAIAEETIQEYSARGWAGRPLDAPR